MSVRSDVRSDGGLARARAIADAVLYEGYVLFPYHAAATKNRYRWQFGVLVPHEHLAHEPTERARLRCQVLLRAASEVSLETTLRFLQPRRRQVERLRADGTLVPVDELEVDGELHTTWEEGVEHEHRIGPVTLDALHGAGRHAPLHLAPIREVVELRSGDGTLVGRIVRTTERIDLDVAVRAETLDGVVRRCTVTVDNTSPWADAGADRAEAVRHGVAGAHLVLLAPAGEFASTIDPPDWALPWAGACENAGTYPVLAGPEGDREVVLAAPIILHDHPEVAEESPGDAYDATEIHELLALCVQGMTDEEKRAARATDPRAAAVVDGADHLPPEMLERLHGAIRGLSPVAPAEQEPDTTTGPAARLHGVQLNEPAPGHPLEEELAEFLGAGETPVERALLDGDEILVGDRVRLRPSRRADAQDVFVADRVATVGKIVETLHGEVQVAVILEDDPGADLHRWYGRFLYFHLDEIQRVPTEPEGDAP